MNALRLSCLLTVVLLAACAQDEASPLSPQPEAPAPHPGASKEPVGETGDIDSDAQVVGTRWARRLQIDRLQATIPKVAGKDVNGEPIIWRVDGQDGLSDQNFGTVLGRPDYVERTEENPASSSLYLKFMRDMARDVCTQIVNADIDRGQLATHTLWRFAPVDGTASEEQLTENLQYLILRFLGMKVDAAHSMVSDYRVVFDAGVSSLGGDVSVVEAQREGWRGVCIGLFESPLFHID